MAVPFAPVGGICPQPTVAGIVAAAARQYVVPVAASECVVAAAAAQRVITVASVRNIIHAQPKDTVVTRGGTHRGTGRTVISGGLPARFTITPLHLTPFHRLRRRTDLQTSRGTPSGHSGNRGHTTGVDRRTAGQKGGESAGR